MHVVIILESNFSYDCIKKFIDFLISAGKVLINSSVTYNSLIHFLVLSYINHLNS